MTMYGRIKPDELGRPSLIWFSAHAARVLGEGPWLLEQDGECLILRQDSMGRRIGKSKTLAAGPLLDSLNADGKLSNLPFPIRRGRHGGFELRVREPDPSLSSRGDKRNTAMPMLVVEPAAPQRQAYTTEEFVRLYALASLALGETLTEEALQTPDDLLAKLPGLSTIKGRFGSWPRFSAFVAYQVSKLQRQHLTRDEAHDRLMELLG